MLLLGTTVPAATAGIVGADVSSLSLPDRRAGAGAVLDSLRVAGVEAIRLRLWIDPPTGEYALPAVTELAAAATSRGFRLLLDLHYSDTWADPAHQNTPAAWQDLPFEELERQVGAYTRCTLERLRAAGVSPELVQLGNEIDHGILWPAGRLDGSPESAERLARLLRAGAAAAKSVDPEIVVVLHVADPRRALSVLERLRSVPFDATAVSYYPWWHGTLDELETSLNELSERFDRDAMVVETAYPWTFDFLDDTHNVVGPETSLPAQFPATPEGQRAFLDALWMRIRRVIEGRARAVFWWEPVWTSPGSPWENVGWLDETGQPLPTWGGGPPGVAMDFELTPDD